MRVVFLGNDAWSVPSLEAVAASGHDLALVATREARPAGRGGKLRPTPVAEAARARDLPLREVATVRSGPGFSAISAAKADVLIVVAYGEILPPEVLRLPSTAPVNVHFSLLPALRGANPVRKAILDGLDVTGVTTMVMDEGLDTGPILLQAEEPILHDDDAGSLGVRLARAGGALLVETLGGLEAGDLVPTPQDEAAATLAPRMRPEEEWIDWTNDADAVDRLVRALSPEPGARTMFRGKVLKVFRALPKQDAASDTAGGTGTIGAFDPEGAVVVCGEEVVLLTDVLPEGRRRMSGAEFVRGYRPEVGERLGERPG
ncbi:MAG: methionyl-tRNA formyltransferase [Actinomycetota bacterium]